MVKFETLSSWVGPLYVYSSVYGYRIFGATYCLHLKGIIHIYSVDGGSVLHKASVIATKTRHVVIQKLMIKKKYEVRIVSWNSQLATLCTVM